jgi:hypothetical protein
MSVSIGILNSRDTDPNFRHLICMSIFRYNKRKNEEVDENLTDDEHSCIQTTHVFY